MGQGRQGAGQAGYARAKAAWALFSNREAYCLSALQPQQRDVGRFVAGSVFARGLPSVAESAVTSRMSSTT